VRLTNRRSLKPTPEKLRSSRTRKENARSTVLIEGYGSADLHLRGLGSRVKLLLGKPDSKKRGFGLREFWVYKHRGVDVSVSTKSGRVLSLFFYNQGADGHRRSPVITHKGLRPADSRSKVLRLYGQPTKSSEAFETQFGKYVREWFSYRSGVGFHFGSDKQVEIISIFSPSRGRKMQ
jgi:hypothetical protein